LGNIVVPSVTTEEIDVSLLTLNSSKTEMSTKQRTLQEDGQKRTQDLRTQLSILQKDLATIIQEQNKIDKEKTSIETTKRLTLENISKHEAIVASLKENKCSYCGTILNKEDLEKHLAEEQAEIYVLVNKTMPKDNLELDKQLEKLYDQEAQIQELIENINKQIVESDAEIKSLIALNFAEITKIECDIQELQVKKGQAIKEITEANSRKENLTTQIKQLDQRKLTIVNQIQQVNINDKLVQLKELEIELLALNFCLTGNKEKILAFNENKTIYDFWSVAFSNKGIRPLLLDKFVNEFNQIVKPYCYKANNGEFIVEFTPTSKTQGGVERNKLGLQVIEKDKIRNYNSLSGGEKTRINLPLCLGLNKWVSKKFGITNGLLGIIVLDELFAWTDTKFRENVAQLLFEEGQKKSIFVIDHADTLVAYTSDLWLVTKENDITQLQVV
jgi:DNA repair exonuclease SbcCD ATPase subunit